jgi:hypothetical protein
VNGIHLPTTIIQRETSEESRDVDNDLLRSFPQKRDEYAGDVLYADEIDVEGMFKIFQWTRVSYDILWEGYVCAIGPKYFWLMPALLMRMSRPLSPTMVSTCLTAAYKSARFI